MKFSRLICVIALICLVLTGCSQLQIEQPPVSLNEITQFSGRPYVVLNDNEPYFEETDITGNSYESYSELDHLGRCGPAMACIGQDIMPTEERGAIGQIKPSGWVMAKYPFVDGKYLYNRCHLLGFQLTGENANEQNLITGTRYFNVEGMLPFENMIAEYVRETGNHVLLKVSPIFEGENLVASGVVMEAKSVEDVGEGICFNVFVYNVQPGVEIDYLTGESKEIEFSGEKKEYILNKSSKKFHENWCENAKDIKAKNKEVFTGTKQEVIIRGYLPCGSCKP